MNFTDTIRGFFDPGYRRETRLLTDTITVCRMYAALCGAGLTPLEATNVILGSADSWRPSPQVQGALATASRRLALGARLSDALVAGDGLPLTLRPLVATGERTCRLGDAFAGAADLYQRDLDLLRREQASDCSAVPA